MKKEEGIIEALLLCGGEIKRCFTGVVEAALAESLLKGTDIDYCRLKGNQLEVRKHAHEWRAPTPIEVAIMAKNLPEFRKELRRLFQSPQTATTSPRNKTLSFV